MFKHKFTAWQLCLYMVMIVILALFTCAMYAMLPTVPHGVTMFGESISGMKVSHVKQQLVAWQKRLSEEQIALQVQGEETAIITLADMGVNIELHAMLHELNELNQGWLHRRIQQRWALRHTPLLPLIHIDDQKLNTALAAAWPAMQRAEPTPAKRIITADDRVTYVQEQPVKRIDLNKFKSLIHRHYKAIDLDVKLTAPLLIDVPLHDVYPEVTVETLIAEGVDQMISHFTTHYRTSASGRVHNIRSTAKSVHNLLLAPGDVFDYSAIVRKTEEKYGFKQAPVIINGKLVPGIGGGICQVSTTLYNAVLRSGLEVIERQNHSLPVRYVPLGQDATFASGHINFKFRNSLDSHLLIRVETTDTQMTVKLFGTMPEGLSYKVYSKIVQVIPSPVQYVRNPQLAQGTTKVISKGETGYVVDTFRDIRQDGTKIKTERISRDHYKAKPSLIAANPGDIPKQTPQKNPVPRKQIIEDGVSGPIF